MAYIVGISIACIVCFAIVAYKLYSVFCRIEDAAYLLKETLEESIKPILEETVEYQKRLEAIFEATFNEKFRNDFLVYLTKDSDRKLEYRNGVLVETKKDDSY